MHFGWAMPDWIFPKDQKVAPVALLGLVVCFILLPLSAMACYLFTCNKYTGPNNIIEETIRRYIHHIKQGTVSALCSACHELPGRIQ